MAITSEILSSVLGRLNGLGTVLHLGAGEGLSLPALLATSARKILLVEPDPALAAGLAQQDDGGRCSLLPLAVGAGKETGTALLRQFNLPALSSLRMPLPELGALFPGLRQEGLIEVKTRALSQIVSRTELAETADNVLIIETPGVEHSLVEELLADGLAPCFPHLFLSAGAAALYEHAAALSAIEGRLVEHGYRVVERDESDPDFPGLYLKLDPLETEIRHLRQTHAEAQARIRKLERRIEELDRHRQAQEKQITALTAERTEQEQRARRFEERSTKLSEMLRALEERHTAQTAKLSATEEAGAGATERENRLRTDLKTEKALTAGLQAKAEGLGRTAAEAERKTAFLREELLRMEAQLGLLKDLMPRLLQTDAGTPGPRPAAARSGPAQQKGKA